MLFWRSEESTGRQRRFLDVRSCSSVLWQSVLLELIPGQAHWQTGLVEEAIRRLEATMTATALELPVMDCNMPWEEHQT